MGDVTETLRYFFSTIAQSMAALLAVGGVFAIYRLQTIDNQIDNTCSAIKYFFKDRLVRVRQQIARGVEVDKWLNKDIFCVLLSEFKYEQDNQISFDPAYGDYYLILRDQLDFKKNLLSKLLVLTAIILFVFVFSIIAFLCIDLSFLSHMLYVFFFLLCLLTVYLSVLIFRFFLFALAGPEENFINNSLNLGDDRRNSLIELCKLDMIKRTEIEKERIKKYFIRKTENFDI